MTTNKTGAHTATPWQAFPADYFVDEKHTVQGFHINGQGNRIFVCSLVPGKNTNCVTEVCEANAAFIVQACNAYEKLVEALRECAKELREWQRDHGECIGTNDALSKARVALAAANGGEK